MRSTRLFLEGRQAHIHVQGHFARILQPCEAANPIRTAHSTPPSSFVD